jgi:hypothetical protein
LTISKTRIEIAGGSYQDVQTKREKKYIAMFFYGMCVLY